MREPYALHKKNSADYMGSRDSTECEEYLMNQVVENDNAIHEGTAKQANKAMTGQYVLAYLLS